MINKTKPPVISIVGLGYVGLPLALAFGRTNLKIYGFDIDKKRISDLKKGIDASGELSKEEIQSSNITYSDDPAIIKKTNFIIVAVPTPVTKANQPDMSILQSASKTVGEHLIPGSIVVFESTVFPGATEEICVPILEQYSGLTCGKDFFVGYSPERINPGDKEHTLDTVIKVVSGQNKATTKIVAETYAAACKGGVHIAPNIKTAEAAKVIENTQRDINIALVNELSLIFHKLGIDTNEVLEAAGTKWNFHKYNPGLVGGHCLSGSHRITLINGDRHKVRTLEDYWHELEKKQLVTKEEQGDATFFRPTNPIRVLSFDKKKEKATFAPISCLSMRPSGPGLRVTTAGNHSIEVSTRHPMIVDEHGEWFVKHAEHVQVGDHVPLLQHMPRRENLRQQIDLIDTMPESWHNRYRVKRKKGTWKEMKDQLNIQRNTGKKASNFYQSDYLPLSIYLELEKQGNMPISHEEVLLVSGRGPSFQAVPATVTIDANFARLIGYYLAEGCITHDKGTRVRFTFFRQEKETIADCISLIEKLGVKSHSLYEDKQFQATQLKVSSELIGHLFEHVLQCGVRSEDARIPEELLYARDEIRWNVLTGLLRGDGGVHASQSEAKPYKKNGKQYAHKNNVSSVNFFSISPELFHGMQLLLMSFNIPFNLDKKRSLLDIHGGEHLARLQQCFLDDKRRKLDRYFKHKIRNPRSKVFKAYKGYVTVPVKKIEPITMEKSYSFEVEGTHTMVTDSGIITHNCIGVDPYYLVYKAEEVGYHPEVITAGRRTNDTMPHFVAEQTIQGLIAANKNIQKAKVLVMGLTFKENVRDFRNSKIADTIERLQELGVHVTGYDPLLTKEEIKQEFDISSIRNLKGEFDAVILATAHAGFYDMADDILSLMPKNPVLIDIKNIYKNLAKNKKVIYKTL